MQSEPSIYHERQSLMRCAVHAVNNLVGKRQFTIESFDRIAEQLTPSSWWGGNKHKTRFFGMYDANVVLVALQKAQLEVEWFDRRNTFDASLVSEACVGLIVNRVQRGPLGALLSSRHWVAVKRIESSVWANLDSELSHPVIIESHGALSVFINALLKDGAEVLMVVKQNAATTDAVAVAGSHVSVSSTSFPSDATKTNNSAASPDISQFLVGGRTVLISEAKLREETKDGGDDEDEDDVNPMFFSEDWSLAAATGAKVWDSALTLVRFLEKENVVAGKDVVELGSGCGLVSLAAAALKCHRVVATDVSSVCAYHTQPNIALNASFASGVCDVAPLDWQQFVATDGSSFIGVFDVVLASDCVWLKELVQPFVVVFNGILRRKSGATGYIAQMERADPGSKTFARVQEMLDGLTNLGLACTLLLEDKGVMLYKVHVVRG